MSSSILTSVPAGYRVTSDMISSDIASTRRTPTSNGVIRRARPPDLGSLDEVLYEGRGLRTMTISPQTRLEWLADAVSHHIASNATYARLADTQGFNVAKLLSTGAAETVPMLPAAIFKRRLLSSASSGEVRLGKSSGTQGTMSLVPRDRPTLERLVGSVLFATRDFFDIPEAREVFVLGPHGNEVGDIWFSYVLTLVGLLHETKFMVRAGQLDHERLWTCLSELPPSTQPTIVAPPSLLWDFLNWMRTRELSVDLGARKPFVITAGGWKRRADEEIDQESLTRLVWECLGVPQARVRDAYNAVELNTVVFECEHGHKHVPPWLTVLARRPADLGLAEPGETGILGFLDATAVSYPALYLSDDLGWVSDVLACDCGRPGPVFAVVRRVQSAEQRGCGLSLNRYAHDSHRLDVAA
jgi:long-chain-fatty-acid---luciferin-component ligase